MVDFHIKNKFLYEHKTMIVMKPRIGGEFVYHCGTNPTLLTLVLYSLDVNNSVFIVYTIYPLY